MKQKPTTTTTTAAPAAPAVYEVTVPGPLKVGGILAYQGARLRMTQEMAAALNTASPGSVRFLGI